MGNIRGWAGPLPAAWHKSQLELQHKILSSMRKFGMTPVLPGFAGHVPAGLMRVFPKANVSRMDQWGHFNTTYCCTYLLDPSDALYKVCWTEAIVFTIFTFTRHFTVCCFCDVLLTDPKQPVKYLLEIITISAASYTKEPSNQPYGFEFIADCLLREEHMNHRRIQHALNAAL